MDAGSGYDTLYTYDAMGRVTKKEFPLLSGQQNRSYIEFVYDDTNRTVTIIDPLRHYIVQQNDKLGRTTSTKSYTGTYGSGILYATASKAYRYDGLTTSLTDFGNDTISYTYDFLGRPTQITLPDSSSISYTCDDTNNKVTLTNGRSYERIYWYNWLSRLEKVEEEYAADTFTSTTYIYDEIGHLLSFTDPENHTTTYTYASAFGLTRTTYPDSKYETYTYDNVRNISSFTDCNGNTSSYTYDDLYRLTKIEYEDQSTVSYTYDLNSNRTQMDDNAPNTGDYVAYTYDQWNRLVTETRHISQDSYPVTYQYDVASRVTGMTYPDSMQILYTYDDLNRITQIKRYIDGQNDEILFDDPQYDVENLLTQFDYGNDIQATYSYDSLDRLLTIDVKDGATSLLDLDYTYDNNNNITQLINGWRDTSYTWHSETESYNYDGLDRLTSASCISWSHSYSYDKAGNRTGKDAITYTVNSVNEVTALSDSTSFTYDDNGNRIQKTKGDDTWNYTYDYANRLTEIEENESTIGGYVYDGDGKRLQKTENSITTTYIYSGINSIYEENSTGSACYVYGPINLIAKRTTIDQESNTYYYHKDHLGSIRSVTDSSKNIIVASTYHPFGETDVEEGSEQYLFNGKELDNTGLYYYGARYYDPEIGRFITKDLLKGKKINSQTLNRYIYCFNNPLKYIDNTGLSAESLHMTLPDGTDITIDLNYKGDVFISFIYNGVRYTIKISNNYKDWDLFWKGKGGNFLEINLMKDGVISNLEGMAFFLGFCDWGRFKGENPNDDESIETFIERLQEEGTILSENDIEKIHHFFELGKRLGQWLAANDNNLYRLYCPAPFNDDAWKQMVNKMAVELIFSYPWNPFPVTSSAYALMELWIQAIKEYLYPE